MPAAAKEGIVPEGRRLFEDHLDGVRIELVDMIDGGITASGCGPVAESAANSQVRTTSSAVKGWPSCHTTPCLSFHVTDVPSLASPPLSRLGMSAARIGTKLASGSNAASGS